MKRLTAWLLAVCVLTLLAGCETDKKQAKEIRGTLESASVLEEQFDAGQEELASEREAVQAIYEQVLQLEHTDPEPIQQLAGKHEVEKERQQLDETAARFQEVHEKLQTMTEPIDLIKDEEQKKEASKLLTIEDERKAAMDTFFEAYREQLDTETAFFDELEQGKFDLTVLEKQIQVINGDSEKMAAAIDQFNSATKQFNNTQQTYMDLAGLN